MPGIIQVSLHGCRNENNPQLGYHVGRAYCAVTNTSEKKGRPRPRQMKAAPRDEIPPGLARCAREPCERAWFCRPCYSQSPLLLMSWSVAPLRSFEFAWSKTVHAGPAHLTATSAAVSSSARCRARQSLGPRSLFYALRRGSSPIAPHSFLS